MSQQDLMTDPPIHHLGYYVASLSNAVAKGVTEKLAPFDLDPLEYAVLRRCYEGYEDTVTGISRDLPVDTARVSRSVTGLTKKGLMRRRRLRTDRRTVRLSLTAEGEAIMPDVIQSVRDQFNVLVEGVTDTEYRAFISLSLKVMANFDAREQ